MSDERTNPNIAIRQAELILKLYHLRRESVMREARSYIGGEFLPTSAEELVNTDLRRVFDLGNEPVVRARLIKIADDSFLFGLVLHHIAGDQWSMGVFGRELSILYNQRRADTAAVLEPLPVSYLDYAHWQRNPLLCPARAIPNGSEWERRLNR